MTVEKRLYLYIFKLPEPAEKSKQYLKLKYKPAIIRTNSIICLVNTIGNFAITYNCKGTFL